MTTIPAILNHSDSSDDGIPNSFKHASFSESSSQVSSATPEENPSIKRFSLTSTSTSSGSDCSTPVSSDMSSRPSLSSCSDVSSMLSFPPSKMPKTSNAGASNSSSSLERDTPTSSRELEFVEPKPILQTVPRLQVPRPKISKDLLNKKLVQIAIRRKSVSQTPKISSMDHPNSKLHIKSLEAGLRVKLTLAPDMISLYNALTPHTTRKRTLSVLRDHGDLNRKFSINNDNYLNDINLVTKPVQLIDNNLVNLSGFSNKVLRTFNLNKAHKSNDITNGAPLPTFNSLNTAVHSLFGIDEYSLVRITRSTTTDLEGSVLLKFETSMPGDFSLIDDDDFTDDFLHSLGKPNDDPSNLFIKKVVARPRYKSDMKVYVVPGRLDCSLYVDKRMLERDLINGVVDLQSPSTRRVLCGFDYNEVLDDFYELLELSNNQTSTQSQPAASKDSVQLPPIGQLKLPKNLSPIRRQGQQLPSPNHSHLLLPSSGFFPSSRSLLPLHPSHFNVPNGRSSDIMPINPKNAGHRFSSRPFSRPTNTKLPPLNIHSGYKSDTNGPLKSKDCFMRETNHD